MARARKRSRHRSQSASKRWSGRLPRALLVAAHPVAEQRRPAAGGQPGGHAQLVGVPLGLGQRLGATLGDQVAQVGLEPLHQVGARLLVEVVEQRADPVDEAG